MPGTLLTAVPFSSQYMGSLVKVLCMYLCGYFMEDKYLLAIIRTYIHTVSFYTVITCDICFSVIEIRSIF